MFAKAYSPYESNNADYKHTCPYLEDVIDNIDAVQLDATRVWQPQHYSELFIGDANIIPSVPAVDVLPVQLPIKTPIFIQARCC